MDIGWPEILIIAVVILVLFGSKKMPDAARSLGRSLRIIKTEVKGLHDDDEEQPGAASRPAELTAGQTTAAPTRSPSTTGAGEGTDLH